MNLRLPRTQRNILLGFVIVVYIIPLGLEVRGINTLLVFLPIYLSLPWTPVFELFGVLPTNTMFGPHLTQDWAIIAIGIFNTAILYAALLFIGKKNR